MDRPRLAFWILGICTALTALMQAQPNDMDIHAHPWWQYAVFFELSPHSIADKNYVGDEACRSCHADKVESYWNTAHHRTSRLPDKETILGSFAEGKNVLRTSNPELSFRMDSKPDGFYETSIWTPHSFSERSERIDLVVGSGRVGQTYLYWKRDLLFQLPVSYWVELDTWINSPGYRDGVANFDRPVPPRCLECHVTYAESVAEPNQYQPDSLVPGISCERCHGPGRDHITETKRKQGGGGKIINPAKLSRDREMEVCTQCHGGRRYPLTTPFAYVPGEPLDDYYRRDPGNADATIDVHGNQVGLLQMSRCYRSASQLSCSTCHDVHQPQRDAAAFSQHCLQCHRPSACGKLARLQDKSTLSCVDCHMPVQASNLVFYNSSGKKSRALVRSHLIQIYDSPPH
jgi:Cytochrome c554 and c-prime